MSIFQRNKWFIECLSVKKTKQQQILTINQFNTAYSLKSETDFAIARNQREQEWRKSQCGAMISEAVITLLCEVTINSICKCFWGFFHPHLRIKSKTSAYMQMLYMVKLRL